jgi:peptidoglycan/LPS O-acetylase OafA/YrhL
MYKGLDYRLIFRNGGLLVFGVEIMLVILGSLEPSGVMYGLFSSAPLRFMGRISYSLYLWHGLVLFVVGTSWSHLGPRRKIVITVVVSFASAMASYYLIERPLVAYAHRRQARRTELAKSRSSSLGAVSL